jgi:hypothetical protein
MTLNAWYHVQARRRQNMQGYQSARYSNSESTDQSTIDIAEATETYSKKQMLWERSCFN